MSDSKMTTTTAINELRELQKEMLDTRAMHEIRKLQKEMFNMREELQKFCDHICADDYQHVYDEIVDGSVIDIGTSDDFRVPKLYKEPFLYTRLQSVAIPRQWFSPEEMKAIEAKLGRKMDKFDTVYINSPNEEGLQTLMLIRLVGGVVMHKL